MINHDDLLNDEEEDFEEALAGDEPAEEVFEVVITYRARVSVLNGREGVEEAIAEMLLSEIEEYGKPVGARYEITRVA